jgi:integrase/recombinase XerD
MDFYVPERLVPFIESYLTQVRPRIDKEHSDYLWLTWGGKRFRGMMVWTAITRITRELFGKEINPHLLRDCAATTLATESLNAAMAARGLLGHRHIKTTEKYYVHAQQLQASRKVNCALQAALRLAPLNRQA